MKYLFLVQGEGRGHMTQAIALNSILKEHGHEVVGVLLGKNPLRKIPSFVYESFATEIFEYESPNFIFDRHHKGIRLTQSIIYNLGRTPKYLNSIQFIKKVVDKVKPDAIVNFYDLMGGLFNFFYRGNRMICIGHQFLLTHPDFPLPKERDGEKRLLHMHNSIVSLNAEKCLALSFRPMKNFDNMKLQIVPPLLRQQLLQANKEPIENQGFLHGYILNEGFANEITTWHLNKQDLPAHFFWDKNDVGQSETIHHNLTFHLIDDRLFLEYLKKCGMFAGTAGFESLCESMYYGKPFLCVPSYNHFEQTCNALDATQNGAGIWDIKFNLDRLIEFRKHYDFDHQKFRLWADQAPEIILKHIT